MQASLSLIIFFATLSFSANSYAYLDPGTGSFVLQMLVAGIMGFLFTLKLYWFRVKNIFNRLLGRPIEHFDLEEKEDSESAETSDEK